MNRITKNDLQIKLDCINKTTKQALDYYGIEFNELELEFMNKRQRIQILILIVIKINLMEMN